MREFVISIWMILFIYSSASVGQSNQSQPFRLKKYIQKTNHSLFATINSLNKISGEVETNGSDPLSNPTPLKFEWGDGSSITGFFPQKHTYTDLTKNYISRVISSYSNGSKDTCELAITFASYKFQKISLPQNLKVSIPASIGYSIGTHLYPSPQNVSGFPSRLFSNISREDYEYILTCVAKIQNEMVNSNVYLFNGKYEQVVLRDSTFGGGYSLWFADPPVFVVNDSFFSNASGIPGLFHEMGHSFTLNTPANYFYGGKIDGNANAIYSETLANIFSLASGIELINMSEQYGLDAFLVFAFKIEIISNINAFQGSYNSYIKSGKQFASWNNPSTQIDETYNIFLTLAYKFFEQAELNNRDYMQSVKRMMQLLQKFNLDWKTRYAQNSNSQSADVFRATLLVAAISFGLDLDLRNDFRNLNFPIDDNIYTELISKAITSVKLESSTTWNYSLDQNYPNPFNPTTKIKFGLPETAYARLIVYDILGREVATLVNQELKAGNHEVNFDAQNLSAGVYFYKLSASKFNSVKKFMLMK